jgi:acetylornithine deacetylase
MDTWLRDHPPTFEWLRYYPPLMTDWSHPITQTLRAAHERVTGSRVPDPSPQTPVNFGAAMDGTWLQAAGIPTIVFGPGEGKIAHGRDEYVTLEEIFGAARSLAVAVLDWCGGQS